MEPIEKPHPSLQLVFVKPELTCGVGGFQYGMYHAYSHIELVTSILNSLRVKEVEMMDSDERVLMRSSMFIQQLVKFYKLLERTGIDRQELVDKAQEYPYMVLVRQSGHIPLIFSFRACYLRSDV